MYESDRAAMVRYQLQKRGIIDPRVLEAMLRLERHRFVPPDEEPYAYEDRPLFIGCGQTISQPFIVALMTETLSLSGSEKVLEIGTGSGYQTALLAMLAAEVWTIERIPELSTRAQLILNKSDVKNIHFRIGDGSSGWMEAAPFDGIMVTAGAPKIPKSLFEQLSIGGRLVAPIGGRFTQELTLAVKMPDGKMQRHRRGGCLFVPLIGEEGWKE
ncbi:MAG: protein-L-isoaspartate(D-aspartate) O-methyltransferase [Calditrichaeota bacterium]|nr:protein-L-isoaspartate(D-aspartate) O-methyltransferase [Calditrichota bacterium]